MLSSLRFLALALVGVGIVGCVEPPTSMPPSDARTPAEEIKGVDSAGNELKLSDYRGKVVLVDFWFDQCPPCRENHRHGKVLMEKYKDRPFIILGVNIDKHVETMTQSEKDQKMTWPSVWDGTWHLNASAYSVEAVPTMILVDHRGRKVKRVDGLPSTQKERKQWDDAIEQLVQEAEKARATTATQ